MIEGPTESSDFDMQLLLSLNDVSEALSERIGADAFKVAPSADQQGWKEWIFHESRRRLVLAPSGTVFKK
jgi:hypothetical protein